MIQKSPVGKYTPDVLRLEEQSASTIQSGQARVKPIYISLDPSNLMFLKLLRASYARTPVKIGDPMFGAVLGVVTESASPLVAPGDFVTGMMHFQTETVVDAEALRRFTPRAGEPLHMYLSVYSHVGRAAMIGMREILKVKEGETVLVSAAAGATGSQAAQIAKAYGCRVVGIAGGPVKCAYLRDELGLDGAIDYKHEDLDRAFTQHFPGGIDAFFDNVGGVTLDTALLHLNMFARIAICGVISQYGLRPEESYRYANLGFNLVTHRSRIEGFIATFSDEEEIDEALRQLYVRQQLNVRVHIIPGFDRIAEALTLLLAGENTGKLMVQVSDEPPG